MHTVRKMRQKTCRQASKNEIKCKNRAGGKALAAGRTQADLCLSVYLSLSVCLSISLSVPASRSSGQPTHSVPSSCFMLILLATNSAAAFRLCFILHSHSPSLFTCRIFAAHQINKHTHAHPYSACQKRKHKLNAVQCFL